MEKSAEQSITEVPQEEINRAYYDAVADGNADAVRHWIERGADVNHRLYDEEWFQGPMPPPLFWTIAMRSPEMAQVLIDYGVDVNATDGGASMLIQALSTYVVDIALMLVVAGADLACTDAEGRTPLQIALEYPVLYYDVIAAIKCRL
jgi:ankyrin repeat protein